MVDITALEERLQVVTWMMEFLSQQAAARKKSGTLDLLADLILELCAKRQLEWLRGFQLDRVRSWIAHIARYKPDFSGGPVDCSEATRRALERAINSANARRSDKVCTEDLLLGTLDEVIEADWASRRTRRLRGLVADALTRLHVNRLLTQSVTGGDPYIWHTLDGIGVNAAVVAREHYGLYAYEVATNYDQKPSLALSAAKRLHYLGCRVSAPSPST